MLQDDQAVHLDCGEMGEGYYEAPLYSQETLENNAGPPGMAVPENNGCLLIQIQVVEIVGEDLLAQNCVGPLWILPDMVQDEYGGLWCSAEGRAYIGVLLVVVYTRALSAPGVALKR